MTLESAIATYGYQAVMFGFIEGEAIVFYAGFLAHQGSLNLYWVMAASIVFNSFTDQFFFDCC
ncbi:hypothetical protein [Thiohalophilus sp.]|uniref:hypothetical protein n=1 Tax=Thiohalophilus sp. TaxID=3028392 RepID=UPI002ACDBFE7|nr:hypothetical protein [Thiohalophilus sp.]MDZ7803235.1 hypothetical protein [Thiohalophilus sp.]